MSLLVHVLCFVAGNLTESKSLKHQNGPKSRNQRVSYFCTQKVKVV